jgi:Domain of unknown function (DUF4062)
MVDVNVDDLIRVFISSKQSEFYAERAALCQVIKRLPLLVPVLAEEWPPQRLEVRERFLRDVRRSPIYVGLFGCIYSEPTVQEYEAAVENPAREVLIYIKRCPGALVDPPLAPFLEELQRRTVKMFNDVEELLPVFEQHLWSAVGRMIGAYLELQAPAPVTRGGRQSPMQRTWLLRRGHLEGLGLPGDLSAERVTEWLGRLKQLARAAANVRGDTLGPD